MLNEVAATEKIDVSVLLKAYRLMLTAKTMAETYEEQKAVCSKYVHSTSRGHEAIQLATAFHLKPYDFASLYYRDESVLLGMGLTPYELMLQLMAKADDPFSGGRTYYGHPSLAPRRFPGNSAPEFCHRHAGYSGHRHGPRSSLPGKPGLAR